MNARGLPGPAWMILMKLFYLLPTERQDLNRFLLWHAGYLLYVSAFFSLVFGLGWFRSVWYLKEPVIFNLLAPLHTVVFILISPFRRRWVQAVVNMYRALDGDLAFCAMAALVGLFGFYLYSLLIWLLGALIPGILYS